LIGKRIELLKELVHGMSRVALLHNMDNAAAKPEWEETESAAHALGLHSELLDVRDLDDLHAAFDAGRQKRVDALIVGADGLTLVHKRTIVDLAERYRLPASYPSREFVEAGGLLAYGINYSELYYRFAAYIDKILKGTKPADLPIEQPTKFDLAINIKTAKALGLTVPQLLLAQANEVLE
jgi:putative ABC transport system substrate-binding protein